MTELIGRITGITKLAASPVRALRTASAADVAARLARDIGAGCAVWTAAYPVGTGG